MGRPTRRRTSSTSPAWPAPTPVWVTFTTATWRPDATAIAAMAAVTTVLPTSVDVPVTTNTVTGSPPRLAPQAVPASHTPDLDRSAPHAPSAAADTSQRGPQAGAGTPLARRGAGIAQ